MWAAKSNDARMKYLSFSYTGDLQILEGDHNERRNKDYYMLLFKLFVGRQF